MYMHTVVFIINFAVYTTYFILKNKKKNIKLIINYNNIKWNQL